MKGPNGLASAGTSPARRQEQRRDAGEFGVSGSALLSGLDSMFGSPRCGRDRDERFITMPSALRRVCQADTLPAISRDRGLFDSLQVAAREVK